MAMARLWIKLGLRPLGKARLIFTIILSNTLLADQNSESIATTVMAPRCSKTPVIRLLMKLADTGTSCWIISSNFMRTSSRSRNMEAIETAASKMGKIENKA